MMVLDLLKMQNVSTEFLYVLHQFLIMIILYFMVYFLQLIKQYW